MPFSDEGFVLESVSMKVLDDGELTAANLRSSWGRDSQSFRFACLLQLYDGKTMRFETQFQVSQLLMFETLCVEGKQVLLQSCDWTN